MAPSTHTFPEAQGPPSSMCFCLAHLPVDTTFSVTTGEYGSMQRGALVWTQADTATAGHKAGPQ
eukprot:5394422-Pyramimonas_sp.AAC.1